MLTIRNGCSIFNWFKTIYDWRSIKYWKGKQKPTKNNSKEKISLNWSWYNCQSLFTLAILYGPLLLFLWILLLNYPTSKQSIIFKINRLIVNIWIYESFFWCIVEPFESKATNRTHSIQLGKSSALKLLSFRCVKKYLLW